MKFQQAIHSANQRRYGFSSPYFRSLMKAVLFDAQSWRAIQWRWMYASNPVSGLTILCSIMQYTFLGPLLGSRRKGSTVMKTGLFGTAKSFLVDDVRCGA